LRFVILQKEIHIEIQNKCLFSLLNQEFLLSTFDGFV